MVHLPLTRHLLHLRLLAHRVIMLVRVVLISSSAVRHSQLHRHRPQQARVKVMNIISTTEMEIEMEIENCQQVHLCQYLLSQNSLLPFPLHIHILLLLHLLFQSLFLLLVLFLFLQLLALCLFLFLLLFLSLFPLLLLDLLFILLFLSPLLLLLLPMPMRKNVHPCVSPVRLLDLLHSRLHGTHLSMHLPLLLLFVNHHLCHLFV